MSTNRPPTQFQSLNGGYNAPMLATSITIDFTVECDLQDLKNVDMEELESRLNKKNSIPGAPSYLEYVRTHNPELLL